MRGKSVKIVYCRVSITFTDTDVWTAWKVKNTWLEERNTKRRWQHYSEGKGREWSRVFNE